MEKSRKFVLSVGRLWVNVFSAVRLSVNRLSVNGLLVNRLSVNRLSVNRSGPNLSPYFLNL